MFPDRTMGFIDALYKGPERIFTDIELILTLRTLRNSELNEQIQEQNRNNLRLKTDKNVRKLSTAKILLVVIKKTTHKQTKKQQQL